MTRTQHTASIQEGEAVFPLSSLAPAETLRHRELFAYRRKAEAGSTAKGRAPVTILIAMRTANRWFCLLHISHH